MSIARARLGLQTAAERACTPVGQKAKGGDGRQLLLKIIRIIKTLRRLQRWGSVVRRGRAKISAAAAAAAAAARKCK